MDELDDEPWGNSVALAELFELTKTTCFPTIRAEMSLYLHGVLESMAHFLGNLLMASGAWIHRLGCRMRFWRV